jgi:hypothetical protein
MCFDTEPCEVFRATHRVARKPHRCSECRRPIRPGTRYESTFTVFDGDAETFKTCPRCERLREVYVAMEIAGGCAVYEATPPLSYLWESIRESREEFGKFALAHPAQEEGGQRG